MCDEWQVMSKQTGGCLLLTRSKTGISATFVDNAPGSYGAGDRGRGAWQVDGGANYLISSVVFTGCHNASQNSAGLRYDNGATGLLLKDCIFRNNDNGITGGSQNGDATVEHCEFDGNGNLAATSSAHNMYINANPDNHGQILAIFNDGGLSNDTMSVQIINNTCVADGTPGNGGNAAFVHLSNADGTQMTAQLFNNLIYGTTLPTLVENASKGTVVGSNNWLPTGVNAGTLTNCIFSASPGFKNAGAKDFSLLPGSLCIGAANQTIKGLPIREYFHDETATREYRIRNTAMDIGVFENTTTGAGIGAYNAGPTPTLRVELSSGHILLSWPSVYTGFELDQAADLNNLWMPVAGPYATDLSTFQVTIAPLASTHFYRLKQLDRLQALLATTGMQEVDGIVVTLVINSHSAGKGLGDREQERGGQVRRLIGELLKIGGAYL
ncbi:MAG: hypothetical protein JWR26_426 [Pedosphaera sp.]|nr:hypothetical protein [Pedosphaera sp.]